MRKKNEDETACIDFGNSDGNILQHMLCGAGASPSSGNLQRGGLCIPPGPTALRRITADMKERSHPILGGL